MNRSAILFAGALLLCAARAEDPLPAAPALVDEPAEAPSRPAALSLLDAPREGGAAPLSGEALLAACVARMPVDRIVLGGHLNMRKRYGVSLREFDFRVVADFSAHPATFLYNLFDEDGKALMRVAAVRDPVRGLLLDRLDDGGPAPAPTDPILGTDVTWLDVGLDFVWWRNPRIVGEDSVKGRTCDVLEVEPPAPLPGCARARLWIDRDQQVVLQAAQIAADGRVIRKLWVRAVQKVDERWIFKDLEVETTGTAHRTRLHFDKVSFPDQR